MFPNLRSCWSISSADIKMPFSFPFLTKSLMLLLVIVFNLQPTLSYPSKPTALANEPANDTSISFLEIFFTLYLRDTTGIPESSAFKGIKGVKASRVTSIGIFLSNKSTHTNGYSEYSLEESKCGSPLVLPNVKTSLSLYENGGICFDPRILVIASSPFVLTQIEKKVPGNQLFLP